MYKQRKVTVVIPALNEAPSIGRVIRGLFNLTVCERCGNATAEASCSDRLILTNSAQSDGRCIEGCSITKNPLVDEIVVCDNGSEDDTAAIAIVGGAIVVTQSQRGYGAACLTALASLVEKDLIVFVDADSSVVPKELPLLLNPLLDGADLVIGSRTMGHCEKGALTLPQRLGNDLASALMRLLWGASVTDLGPFRAVTNDALTKMEMADRRFGWTVEMQVRALQLSQHVVEVPVSTRRRIGKSKISGTVRGVIGASHGILGTIAKLYWRQKMQSLSSLAASQNTDLVADVKREQNRS